MAEQSSLMNPPGTLFELVFEAMTCSARALELLPLGVTEFEFNMRQDGSVRSVEFWPSFPRMDVDRKEIPIPSRHARVFKTLGEQLVGLSYMTSADDALVRRLHRALQSALAEVCGEATAQSPARAHLELMMAIATRLGVHAASVYESDIAEAGVADNALRPFSGTGRRL